MLGLFTWAVNSMWNRNRGQTTTTTITATAVPAAAVAVVEPQAPVPIDLLTQYDQRLQQALSTVTSTTALEALETLFRDFFAEETQYEMARDVFQQFFPLSEQFVSASADSSKNITPKVLLLVLQGVVYDATGFVDQHPGGPYIMQMNAGSEAWETFASLHSEETIKELLPTFRVGAMQTDVAALIGPKKETAPLPATSTSAEGTKAATKEEGKKVAARAAPKAYRVQSITMLTELSTNVTNPTASICFEGSVTIPAGGHMRVHCPADRNLRTQRATTRSYTPYETTDSTFTISVKHYPGGAVSGYLHSLQVGEEVEMSGPDAPHVPLRPSEVNGDLLLVAGGTGIAPVYSIAQYILKETTHAVALFACFRNADDALLLEQLEELLYSYGTTRVELHIVFSRLEAEESLRFVHERHAASPRLPKGTQTQPAFAHAGRLEAVHVSKSAIAQRATVAYVCGPPSFAQTVESVLREGESTSVNLFPTASPADPTKMVTRVFPL